MEGLMLWVVSVEVALCLLVAVLACVCGCRKTVPKNELLGLAGMVKLTNPEESYSQNGQWPPATTSSASLAPDANANKRSSTTANRSLPDLPVDFGQMRNPDGSVIWESQEGGGDTGSELYATVEENSRPGTSNLRGKKAVPRELSSESKEESDGARDGTSPSGTPGVLEDDGFPPYARLRKEHPYDKLRKSEHPYAQVRPPSSREPDADQIPLDRLDSCDPVPPPRTRKSVSYSSLTPPPAAVSSGVAAVGSTCIGDSPNTPRSPHSPRSLHSPPGSVPDIPAATAIAGRISANQELPYMTPPISTSQGQPGQHFSGDSQDSSKGYTSISVREPLANIRSQRPHDSHYATVSDDSDEMYAAIEDPGQVYTSGSETYAQIQPLALASVAVLPAHPRTPEVVDCEDIVSTSASTVQGTQPLPSAQPQGVQSVLAPQPPSVDSLKHVAQAHSRQASSSSAASSVTNLGSPKPEKRPANSPLPPPPANLASPEGGCSLEDMYAKVVKKKRGSSEETDGRSQDTDSPRSQPSSPQRRFSTPQPTEVSTSVDPGYETVSAAELKARESVQQQHPGYETVRRNFSSDVDPNYEELQVQSGDPGYAHIPAHSDGREPEYARISRSRAGSLSNEPDVAIEPDYASISRGKKSCSGTNGTKSNEIDDPGYEQAQLKKENLAGDDSDQDNPGYERVHARSSTVRKLCTLEGDEVASDPGYEQVRLAGAIHKHNMSDQDNEGLALNQFDPNQFDPNYETVLNEEPNYESVRYYDDSGGRNDPSCKQVEAGDAASNPLLGNCKDRSNVR